MRLKIKRKKTKTSNLKGASSSVIMNEIANSNLLIPLQSDQSNITVSKISKQSKVTSDKSLEALLSERNLSIDQIVSDGACLFRAISFQMNGHQDQHLEYREEICQFMR